MTTATEQQAYENISTSELRETLKAAIGRVFGMMQRPGQDGDVAEYNRCRAIAMDIADVLKERGEL